MLFTLSFGKLSCPVGTRLIAQELYANDGLISACSADEWISAAGMRCQITHHMSQQILVIIHTMFTIFFVS